MNLTQWMKRKRVENNIEVYDREEVSNHHKGDDCWIVIDYKVYDVTEFLKIHPAGKKVIMRYAGKDCTDIFKRIHASTTISKFLFNEHIGNIKQQ